MHGEVGGLLRTGAVIVMLVLLGQVLELRARSRTSARDSRICSALAPKTARSDRAPTAPSATCRSSTCTSAIVCASGPASGSRSTASWSTARRRSTNRWSPASRSRSRRRPVTTVTGGTVNGTGTFVMSAPRRQRHAARADRADGERGAALARADSAPRRRRLRVVRAGGHRGGDGRRSSSGRPSVPSRGSRTRW